MSKKEHWNSDFGFEGSCTTFHHPHFQIVVVMIIHCKRTMNGLNPHALPHEPEVSNSKLKEEKESPSKSEKMHQQQSCINKLMIGCDFGWKIPSMHERINKNEQTHRSSSNTNNNNNNNNNERLAIFDEDDEENEEFSEVSASTSVVSDAINAKHNIKEKLRRKEEK